MVPAIQHQERNQIIQNSAMFAAGMVAIAGVCVIAARDALGNIDAGVGTAIAMLPLSTTVIQHFLPTNKAAVISGLIFGMIPPLLVERPTIAYAVGAAVSGVTTAALAAIPM